MVENVLIKLTLPSLSGLETEITRYYEWTKIRKLLQIRIYIEQHIHGMYCKMNVSHTSVNQQKSAIKPQVKD